MCEKLSTTFFFNYRLRLKINLENYNQSRYIINRFILCCLLNENFRHILRTEHGNVKLKYFERNGTYY